MFSNTIGVSLWCRPYSRVHTSFPPTSYFRKYDLTPLMLVLLLIHALVGYVELGTNSWIAKITGSIMESKLMAAPIKDAV